MNRNIKNCRLELISLILLSHFKYFNEYNYWHQNLNSYTIMYTRYNHFFFILLFVPFCVSRGVSFQKIQQCIQKDNKNQPCQSWNTTVQLFYSYNWNLYMCFPSETFLLTSEKTKSITEIAVGDQILGFDFQTNKPVFSKVTAWLHRDTISETDFVQIQAQNGEIYLASSKHNIAYNKNGILSFKYAEQFVVGDQLIGLSGIRKVLRLTTKNQKGLFSPMTQIGNFFIKNNKDSNQMILVHCLSEVENPYSKQNLVGSLLNALSYLGLNHHDNIPEQEYVHPITYIFPLMSGNNHQSTIRQQIHSSPEHFRSSSSSSGKQAAKKNTINLFLGVDYMNQVLLL